MRRGRMGEVVEGGAMGYRAGQGEGCPVVLGLDEKGRVDDKAYKNTGAMGLAGLLQK